MLIFEKIPKSLQFLDVHSCSQFELEYSHTVDAKPECNYNNQNRVQAAVGVSLDPIEGSLGTLHMNLILTFIVFIGMMFGMVLI